MIPRASNCKKIFGIYNQTFADLKLFLDKFRKLLKPSCKTPDLKQRLSNQKLRFDLRSQRLYHRALSLLFSESLVCPRNNKKSYNKNISTKYFPVYSTSSHAPYSCMYVLPQGVATNELMSSGALRFNLCLIVLKQKINLTTSVCKMF